MPKLKVFHQVLILFFAVVILPLPASAISQLSIYPGGDGIFVLQGRLEGVGGLHTWIAYDSSTLTNPRISLGPLMAGVAAVVNPSNPIQIAGVVGNTSGITASGTIATISFDRIGSTPGTITTLTAKLIDPSRKAIAMAQPAVTNPAQLVATTDPPPATTTATGSGGVSSGGTGTGSGSGSYGSTTESPHPFIVGGTVTFPPTDTSTGKVGKEPTPQTEQEMQDRRPLSQVAATPPPEPAEVEAPAPKAATPAIVVAKPIQSVLERFRLFTGEKSTKSLTALFNRDISTPFSQEPPIAIADGKGTIKVMISRLPGDKTPNLTFKSARFVSVARSEGAWEIEVAPDKGAVYASITILSNGRVQEFPLTVAPKADVAVKKAGVPSEADFNLFLNERGTAAAPKFDLNGDGKRDYLDDYIFTANYLAKAEEATHNKKTAQQKP